MADLRFENVHVRLGAQLAVRDVSTSIAHGAITALIGANGAGKTTVMRAALGLARVDRGTVRLDGRDPRAIPALERARIAAYLPQQRSLAWPMRVSDVVGLGRFAFGVGGRALGPRDRDAVTGAMVACGLLHLAQRRTDQISGGELARVHIARALASQAPLLLADEPTAALDPLHAEQVMASLRRFADKGGAALIILHDLALAARHADRIIALRDGAVIGDGATAEVLTPALIEKAFGVKAAVGAHGAVEIIGPA